MQVRTWVSASIVMLLLFAPVAAGAQTPGPDGQAPPDDQQPAPTQGQVRPGAGLPPVSQLAWDLAATVVVEIALIQNQDGFGDDVPPTIIRVANGVDLTAALPDIANSLEAVENSAGFWLSALTGQVGPVSDVVVEAGGALDAANRQRVVSGELIEVESVVYVQALADLLADYGRPGQDVANELDAALLDDLLASVSVERILNSDPPPAGPSPIPALVLDADEAAGDAPPAVQPIESVSADDPGDSNSVAIAIAIAALVAVTLVGLAVLVLSRRTSKGGKTRADAAETARLIEAARRLTAADNVAEVQELAVREAITVLDGDAGAFVLAGDELTLAYQTRDYLLLPERLGEGVIARVISSGRPVAEVSQSEPAVVNLPTSLAAVPVITQGKVRGTLIVFRHHSRPITSDELDAVTLLAPVVSAALEMVDKLGTMEELALVDGLTSLGNRRALDQAVARLISESWDSGRPVSIVMIDIDNFKIFNDTNGHPAGDEALRRIGRTLAENLREGDAAYRYGGEEFCILMPDTPEGIGMAIAERIRVAVEAVEILGRESQPGGTVTVSMGVASGTGPDVDGARRIADEALYVSKESGRNRVTAASSLSADPT